MNGARRRPTVRASPLRGRDEGEVMTEPYETAVRGATPRDRSLPEAERGVGWMVFAAVMLATGGALNGIYGIAAIASSKFFVAGASYVIGDLKTLGWIAIALGAAEMAAALGILAFAQWARWLGAGAAAVNALVQLLIMPAAPFLALALLVMNVLVVYALVAYGNHWRDG
jgi:hypothetical protein